MDGTSPTSDATSSCRGCQPIGQKGNMHLYNQREKQNYLDFNIKSRNDGKGFQKIGGTIPE